MWNTTLYANFGKDLKDIFLTCAHLVYGNLAAEIAMYLRRKLLEAITHS